MSDYKIINDTTVLRLKDNAFVPHDFGNRDYVKYLDWVAEGNEPLPRDE